MTWLEGALANREAYDLWAESYPPLPHNPLMRAEQALMADLLPDVVEERIEDRKHPRILDLACGTGRYGQLLQERGATAIVAMDYSLQMLLHSHASHRVRADMMRLPFAAGTFDLIVCGLAVGHAPRLASWMLEMERILAPGGTLVYSDFHSAAAQAGMKRSFTDSAQRKHVLAHCRYDFAAHVQAAAVAGLTLERVREARVGEELNEPFTGSEAFYRRWAGLPVVLAIRARKLD